MLEGQGLLELRPRKGVRILPLSPDDMAEIYDVLTELESLAAEQAALAGYQVDELQELARAIDDMDTAIALSIVSRTACPISTSSRNLRVKDTSALMSSNKNAIAPSGCGRPVTR